MLNYYQKYKTFILIIFFGLFLRLLSFYFFQDKYIQNEWGILLENYNNFNIIGINFFNGTAVLQGVAFEGYKVFPSIYMPPFYLYFIIFWSYLITKKYLVASIILFQIFLSIINSHFFYRLLNMFFKKKVSLIGLSIFIFFPLNIYCTSQISSITLQVFFITMFFYFLFKSIKKQKNKNIIFFAICSAILILLRGEFILILLFSLFFLWLNTKKFKPMFFNVVIILTLISPYLIRNYMIFNELTITKSFGFNLWKGNNQYSKAEGSEILYDFEMIKALKEIKPDNFYELERDNIYKHYAFKNIKEDPMKYLILYIKKIVAFILVDKESTYPNYYNVFHIMPKMLIGAMSLIGFFIVGFRNVNFLYFNLCFLLNVLIFSTFFILPRYQLGVLPLQIILCCVVIEKYFLKFKNTY